MADEVAQVRLPDGTVVWARVAGAEQLAHGGEEEFSDTGFADRLVSTVDGISDLVRGVAGSLREATRAFAPDEVSVEFGIDLTATSGKVVGLLAGAEAKAAIKVALTWQEVGTRAARGDSRPVGPGPDPCPASDPARGAPQDVRGQG